MSIILLLLCSNLLRPFESNVLQLVLVHFAESRGGKACVAGLKLKTF